MSILRKLMLPAAALVAIGYLAAMIVVGTAPVQRQLVRFEAKGLLGFEAGGVRRVEIERDGRSFTLVRRGEKSWMTADGRELPATAAGLLETAVNVLHRSGPVREIEADELAGVDTRPFGLADPPLIVSVFGDADAPALTARFGALNPEGILQYVRVDGSDHVYLMSRFVAGDWLKALEEVGEP